MKPKVIIISALFAVLAVFILFAPSGDKKFQPPLQEGAKLPEIALESLDGKPWGTKDGLGSVVFLNFWATWCDSCREEFPSIQALYDKNKDHPGFQMVTVIYNDTAENARKFLADNNYTVPVYIDNRGAAAAAFGLVGVPETYVANKDGVVRKKIMGPANFASDEVAAFFAKLLNNQP